MAVIGLRVHSGWTAAVVVGGSVAEPRVLHRTRLELIEGKIPCQPYHYVEHMGGARARSLLAGWQKTVKRLSHDRLKALTKLGREAGAEVNAVAILLSSGRPLPELEKILASHALIHSAEGEFYRDALKAAGQALGLLVVGAREKQVFEFASTQLKTSPAAIKAKLDSFKKSVGSPWTADEKLATLAAWMQLAPRAAAAKR